VTTHMVKMCSLDDGGYPIIDRHEGAQRALGSAVNRTSESLLLDEHGLGRRVD
jgi:hypothetical protein